MVQEREPSQISNSSHRLNQPEFGVPSPMRSSLPNDTKHSQVSDKPKSGNPFNIPKPNRPRPEHHRSDHSQHRTQPQHPSYRDRLEQHGRDILHKAADRAKDFIRPEGSTAGSATSIATANTHSQRTSHASFDPLRPVAPSTYMAQTQQQGSYRPQDDFFEIPRPQNFPVRTQQRTQPPLFSSSGTAQSNKLNRLFVDLTRKSGEDQDEDVGSYTYLDAAKANANIKALLEGAFDDEEDHKPRTRSRKKKVEAGDIDDLASKLKGANLNEQEEEEEEEEIDDGTREGLTVKLLPHQIDGVEWMIAKETGSKRTKGKLPKGGILADDMGLGKTVQSIALIMANPKPKKTKEDGQKVDKSKEINKRRLPANLDKGTLVVAPLALIKQWEAEIKSKVEDTHRLKVLVHHGPQRTKRADDLKSYDVVITTYQILVSEHGGSSPTDSGPKVGCFGVNWYRIMLDEAHTIKNRNTKATQACCALSAEYRWCLSGTPMQNNLDELQSLIHFLRIEPYSELSAWRDSITRPMNNGHGAVAIKRLQVLLGTFMKRRTKDVLKLDGALANDGGEGKKSSGFQITKRDVEKVNADFTPEERNFYNRLEQRTDNAIAQLMGDGNINYASALVLLLRLRQACNHPDLVKSELAQDKDALLNESALAKTGTQKKSADADIDAMADLFGGMSVKTKQCDICQIKLSKSEIEEGASRCTGCEKDMEDEVFKKGKSGKKGIVKKSEGKSKVHAKAARQRNRRVVLDSDDEDEESDEGEWLVSPSQQKATRLGKAGGQSDEDAEGGGDTLGSEDSQTESESASVPDKDSFDSESDSEDPSIVIKHMQSTKIRHLLKILKSEVQDHKFIVFSFFTSMLDLIEPFLDKAGIEYTRYDGAMRNDLREASLDNLRHHSATRVLLCSLRAGSLGLNLTAASRVVILEPFWNPVSLSFPNVKHSSARQI